MPQIDSSRMNGKAVRFAGIGGTIRATWPPVGLFVDNLHAMLA